MKRYVTLLLLAALFLMPVNSPASEMLKTFNKDLPKWLELFRKGDSREKRLVLQNLDSLRYPEYRQNDAYSQVLKALDDKDPSVREEAASLLKFIGEYSEACCRETGVVPALTKALTDYNPRVRAASAAALAYYKDNAAIKPLTERLKDADLLVRIEAAYAVGELGKTYIGHFRNEADVAALTRAFDYLLDILNDDGDWRNKFVQKEAIIAMAGIAGFVPGGMNRAEAVLKRKANDGYLRLAIIRILGNLSYRDANDILVAAARDKDELVRISALDSIRSVPPMAESWILLPPWDPFTEPSESREAFLKRFAEHKKVREEHDKKVRAENQRIIDSRLPVLMEALKDPSDKVRSKAIEGLDLSAYGKKGLPALADFIAANGKESDLAAERFMIIAERTAAKKEDRKNYKVLVNVDAATALLKAFDGATVNRAKIVFMLGSFADKRVEDKLREAANDPSQEVRRLAAEALDKITLSDPIEVYSRELKSSDNKARENAASELGKLRDKRAIEPLIGALGDADAGVRKDAVSALGYLRDNRAAWPLIRLLKDPDPKVRSYAAAELSSGVPVGKDTSMIGPLMEALHDADKHVRWSALRALGHFDDPRVEDAALGMLKDEAVRKAAVIALGERRSAKGVMPLIALLSENDDVALSSAEALGKIGDMRAVDPLIDALMDKFKRKRLLNYDIDLRMIAAKSLGSMKAQKAVPYLLKVFMNQDEPLNVRFSALAALGDIGDPSAIGLLKSKMSEGNADEYFIYIRTELLKTIQKLEKKKGN